MDEILRFFSQPQSALLSQSKIFHASQVNVDQCCQLLTAFLYKISQGEQFAPHELSDLFFACTKLFQSKNFFLRRLTYTLIRELHPSPDEALIVINCLLQDINNTNISSVCRGNAIRLLFSLLDASLLPNIERVLLQSLIITDSIGINKSALIATQKIWSYSPDAVVRWKSEISQLYSSSTNQITLYHALSLLYKIVYPGAVQTSLKLIQKQSHDKQQDIAYEKSLKIYNKKKEAAAKNGDDTPLIQPTPPVYAPLQHVVPTHGEYITFQRFLTQQLEKSPKYGKRPLPTILELRVISTALTQHKEDALSETSLSSNNNNNNNPNVQIGEDSITYPVHLLVYLRDILANESTNTPIVLEAAKVIFRHFLNSTQTQYIQLVQYTVDILMDVICKPYTETVEKYAILRLFSQVITTHKSILAAHMGKFERLLATPQGKQGEISVMGHQSLSLLAICIAMKVGSDSSLHNSLSSLQSILSNGINGTDENKLHTIETVTEYLLTPNITSYRVIIAFFDTLLREEHSYIVKNYVITCYHRILSHHQLFPNLSYIILDKISSFIEDSDYTRITIRIINLLGQYAHLHPTNPEKYFRILLNRSTLESPSIRCASLTAIVHVYITLSSQYYTAFCVSQNIKIAQPFSPLQFVRFHQILSPIRNATISIILSACIEQDDTVRDRAVRYITILQNLPYIGLPVGIMKNITQYIYKAYTLSRNKPSQKQYRLMNKQKDAPQKPYLKTTQLQQSSLLFIDTFNDVEENGKNKNNKEFNWEELSKQGNSNLIIPYDSNKVLLPDNTVAIIPSECDDVHNNEFQYKHDKNKNNNNKQTTQLPYIADIESSSRIYLQHLHINTSLPSQTNGLNINNALDLFESDDDDDDADNDNDNTTTNNNDLLSSFEAYKTKEQRSYGGEIKTIFQNVEPKSSHLSTLPSSEQYSTIFQLHSHYIPAQDAFDIDGFTPTYFIDKNDAQKYITQCSSGLIKNNNLSSTKSNNLSPFSQNKKKNEKSSIDSEYGRIYLNINGDIYLPQSATKDIANSYLQMILPHDIKELLKQPHHTLAKSSSPSSLASSRQMVSSQSILPILYQVCPYIVTSQNDSEFLYYVNQYVWSNGLVIQEIVVTNNITGNTICNLGLALPQLEKIANGKHISIHHLSRVVITSTSPIQDEHGITTMNDINSVNNNSNIILNQNQKAHIFTVFTISNIDRLVSLCAGTYQGFLTYGIIPTSSLPTISPTSASSSSSSSSTPSSSSGYDVTTIYSQIPQSTIEHGTYTLTPISYPIHLFTNYPSEISKFFSQGVSQHLQNTQFNTLWGTLPIQTLPNGSSTEQQFSLSIVFPPAAENPDDIANINQQDAITWAQECLQALLMYLMTGQIHWQIYSPNVFDPQQSKPIPAANDPQLFSLISQYVDLTSQPQNVINLISVYLDQQTIPFLSPTYNNNTLTPRFVLLRLGYMWRPQQCTLTFKAIVRSNNAHISRLLVKDLSQVQF